nr:reverse transcriptase domain-containing protein [Tanacetum cinerariifolium]
VTTERLDWHNHEGNQYPFDLCKLLLLIPDCQGHQVIPQDYFINNDLKYLKVRAEGIYPGTLPLDRVEVLGTSRSAQRQIHKGERSSNGDRGRRTDLDDTVSGLLKRMSPPWRQEGGKKAPPQGPTIRVNGGGPLQTVVPYAMVKMRRTAPDGDARDMIRKCSDYQIHCPITRHPQQPLTPIMAPWPFYKWGIDIAGPFSGRTREGQIFNSRHGLLHEMDRSKGSGNNYGRTECEHLSCFLKNQWKRCGAKTVVP